MDTDDEIRLLQEGHIKLNSHTLSLAITTFLTTVGRYCLLLPEDAKAVFDLRIRSKLENLLVILRDFQNILRSFDNDYMNPPPHFLRKDTAQTK